MPNDQAGNSAEKVSVANEMGTLYPMPNLIVIPLSTFNKQNDFGDKAIMKRHISDSFEAERNYIRSSRMIFIFERDDFNCGLALKVLLDNWASTEINVEYTQG
ncbi:hypothetical protein [Pollutibacter soli]|uniref:hypothetical protein n=1 Tax=Pollutibacter soli TaxID=3034157 RepID=UPI003013A5B3